MATLDKTPVFVEATLTAPGAATPWWRAQAQYYESVGRDYGKILYTDAFTGTIEIHIRYQPNGITAAVEEAVDFFVHEDGRQMVTFDIAAGAEYRLVAGGTFSGSTRVVLFSGREAV